MNDKKVIDTKVEDKLMYSSYYTFWRHTGMTYTEYKEKFFGITDGQNYRSNSKR